MVILLACRLGLGKPLLKGQKLDHCQLHFIFIREVIPGDETYFTYCRFVGSLDRLQINKCKVLEVSQTIFKAFQVLIFQDQIQDL
jgi:hypothetical protein